MSAAVSEYELEALPELGAGYAGELEGDRESEQFFGALANLARRGAERARNLGQAAARVVLRALSGPGVLPPVTPVMPRAGCYKGTCPTNSRCPAQPCDHGGTCKWVAGDCCCVGAAIREFEGELLGEFEGEISPIRKIYPDAMLEHLGHAAAETHNEAEAEALAGALIPLAARVIPRAAPTLMRATPGLVCGLAGVVRGLHRNPATRPLVRVVPAIVRGTAANVAQKTALGVPVTPQEAVRTLARQTLRVLGSPQASAQAFRRSLVLDRHFHRRAGIGRPPGARLACPSCGAEIR
jgi:hypothetical protein